MMIYMEMVMMIKEKLQQIFTEGDNNKNYITTQEVMTMRLNKLTCNLDPRMGVERSRLMA